MATRRLPIHHSLIRPLLLAGAEREATMITTVLTIAGVFYTALYLSVILAGGVLFTGLFAQWAFQRAAKKDPLGIKTYKRSLQYQDFYSRLASPERPSLLDKMGTAGITILVIAIFATILAAMAFA